MKATGIVRRIDDLGRVVIPKEIRRTQAIRVGDPLEIFVSGEGEVVFRKYSPIGEMGPAARNMAEVLGKAVSAPVVITDRDRVVAAGPGARDAADRPVAPGYGNLMDRRSPWTAGKLSPVPVWEGGRLFCTALAPVIAGGDLAGSVGLAGDADAPPPDDTRQALLRLAAAYLGRQLEE